MHTRIPFLVLAVLLLIVVAGCGGRQPMPAVRPTRTRMPTFTPRPTNTQVALAGIAASTATPVPPTAPPTATLPPTAPPKPVLTAHSLVNVRGGPGTTYPRLGQLQAAQQFEITGRNADGDWWQFNYEGDPGWVSGSMVTVNDAAQDVRVVEVAPPPVPVAQAPQPQPQVQPQPQPQPQPSPAPQTRFAAAGSEERNAADTRFERVTFWGRLGDTGTAAPVGDAASYKLRVVAPTGTAEKGFKGIWEVAYGGWSDRQFIYNVKIELPRGVGNWTAVVVDGSGNKISDEQSGALSGKSHDLIMTWRPR